MNGELIFDKEHHLYWYRGETIISNTDILEASGLSDFSDVPEQHIEAARTIGTDVHTATYLLDTGRRWLRKYRYVSEYVLAWKKFKQDFQFKPRLREQPLCDPIRRIATTPDAYGDSIEGDITVEIKTCKIKDCTALQTAFQEYCITLGNNNANLGILRANKGILESSRNRFAVELRSDGTYTVRRFEDKNDLRVFFSFATGVFWQRSHRI